MAFYNKGALTQDLPGQGTLCFLNSSGVQVPVMTQSFGSMAVVVEGTFAGEKKIFVPGAAGIQSSLFYTCFGYMTCSFGLLSLKSSSVSQEMGQDHFELFP